MVEHCRFNEDDYALHVSRFLERPWTLMKPLYIGEVPSWCGTPDLYCSVKRNLEPAFVVNVYGASSFGVQVTFWHTWLVIGSLCKIHFISLEEKKEQVSFDLGYLCSIYPDGDYLLVSSDVKVFCFGKEPCKRWESPMVGAGLDGVEVTSVEGELVLGKSSDYNDQWQPFTLSLATGEVIRADLG